MSTTWEQRAEVIRWMTAEGKGPRAAIEHFKLDVNERTLRIWRAKLDQVGSILRDRDPAEESPADELVDQEPVDPERERRDRALDRLAERGVTVRDVADELDVSVGEVRGWVLAWMRDGEQTPAAAGKRFDIPAQTITRWAARAERPHVQGVEDFQETASGDLKPSPLNLSLILQRDPWWRDRCRWDEFARLAVFRVGASDDWVPLSDEHERDVQLALAAKWQVNFDSPTLHAGLLWWAQQHRFHPVRRYLDACADAWDGVPRIERLLVDYFGTEADDLSAVLGRKWLVSAVARIFQPGCKVDTVLVIQGAQGTRKSTGFRAMVGEQWFSDAAIDVRNAADAAMLLEGVWMFELAELDALSRAESTATKSWLSRTHDRYRAPYARNPEKHARQSVFVGTTNEAAFLPDTTGNRRFWVRRHEAGREADVDRIARDRDQLWGEAVRVYRARHPSAWWLTPAEAALAERAAEAHQVQHPWTEAVGAWIAAHRTPWDHLTTGEILEFALEMPVAKARGSDGRIVAQVMSELGYRSERRSRDDRTRVWRRSDTHRA